MHITNDSDAPVCPYCATPWTTAMLHLFERHSRGTCCTCCVVLPGLDLGPEAALPQQDLCCERCGKPIYSAPKAAAHADSTTPETHQYRNSSQS
jgi:hypothetical protein